MDPRACFLRLIDALKNNDNSEAIQASNDLLGFLLSTNVKPFSVCSLSEREELQTLMAKLADKLEVQPLRKVISY